MKRGRRLATPVLSVLALLAILAVGQEHSYVGAEKCRVCHRSESQGRQYPIWESTRHSKSLEALGTTQAAEAAKSMGVDNPAEAPECLKCHAPLAEKAPELKAEGVSCEVCHGPGSDYKKLSVMKDKDAAVKNGLVLYGSPEAIKAHCLKCHGNPHGVPFDFAVAWTKIKHPIPDR
jgi:hypothetical protein